ncbi:hypothetical protein M407DRAFT_32792 [Tulasnella calospora MUT 4182]|uniref:Uncharacterized protein n=1 Tax=Tulasnella calospora MUT 4182 TaxID=1051891 RepID=A0A0C3K7Z2_9AGAM|nr:hypothetical protein M407DRAFT_32792 [Tulasnella calospora MUT 4182]
MAYDSNALGIQGVMLIRQEPQDQEICAMAISSDDHFMGPGFDLAVAFTTNEGVSFGEYRDPRKMTIWRVSPDKSDHLAARLDRSFLVFQPAPFFDVISCHPSVTWFSPSTAGAA